MPDLHLRLHDDESGDAVLQQPLAEDEALALLSEADITAAKVIPWGSNYTFAVALETEDGQDHLGIYKPRVGERPLWDFPHGTLYLREHASYLVSKRLGWNIVPPTIVREGPHGIGSLQVYVEPKEDRGDDDEFWGRRTLEIERLVLFDHITNNADRKITHCLLDRHDRIWGIDHGLTFHDDFKLRTVLWQFAGSPVSAELLDDLRRFIGECGEIRSELKGHLSGAELDALFARIDRILTRRRYPRLDPRWNVPYGWW
jgi:hypothetical protein